VSDLPTPAEVVTAAKVAFRGAVDPDGTGAVDLAAGSRNDLAISTVSAVGNRLSLYAADRVTASRIASASGDDLDVLAADLFGLTRKPDVAATGFLRFTRAGSVATVFPAGSRFGVPATSTQPAIVFQVAQDTPAVGTSAVVPVVCAQTGVVGNIAGPAAVTGILDVLPDPTWQLDPSFVPPTPFGGGADAETDALFRARLQLTTPQAARQRGTKAAILTGGLNVPGVAFATPIEVQDGTVRLYAGDAGFNLPSTLALAIATELLDWRCFGVPVPVLPYAVQTVAVQATVYMARPLANYSAQALVTAAVNAVVAYFEGRPQPDEYYTEAIIAAIYRAHPEVQHVVLAAPAASVVRPADTGYGVVTALNRYRVDPSSITLSFQPPNTL
jgi:uncharacterized phage protein gp47/JayE